MGGSRVARRHHIVYGNSVKLLGHAHALRQPAAPIVIDNKTTRCHHWPPQRQVRLRQPTMPTAAPRRLQTRARLRQPAARPRQPTAPAAASGANYESYSHADLPASGSQARLRASEARECERQLGAEAPGGPEQILIAILVVVLIVILIIFTVSFLNIIVVLVVILIRMRYDPARG